MSRKNRRPNFDFQLEGKLGSSRQRNKRINFSSLESSASNLDSLVSLAEGSVDSLYFHAVISTPDSIQPTDNFATEFLLNEFNRKTNELFAKKFVKVNRIAKLILNSGQLQSWIYYCSCDNSRSSIVKSLGSVISSTLDEDLCIHVKVLKVWITRIDLFYGSILPSNDNIAEGSEDVESESETGDEVIISLPISPSSVFIKLPEDNWGVVHAEGSHILCLTCHHDCIHVKHVMKAIEEDTCPDYIVDLFCGNDQDAATSTPSIGYVPTCHSQWPIPVEDENMKEFLRGSSGVYSFQIGMQFDCLSELNYTTCRHGFLVEQGMTAEVLLYTQYNRINVFVTKGVFPDCHLCGEIQLDGSKCCLLNMGKFLIGHDVLRDYFHHFLNGRMPLYTYYKVWCAHQKTAGHNESGMLSYFNFRHSWYSFLKLLEIDLGSEFICDICQENPDVILFDGTAMAFRKTYVPSEVKDLIGSFNKSSHRTQVEHSFITNNKTRNLLSCYCNKSKGITSFAELKSLVGAHCPVLLPVLNWIAVHFGDETRTAPEPIRHFLQDISKRSPVCGLICPDKESKDLLQFVKNEDVKKDPSKLMVIQRKAPFLFRLINNLKTLTPDDLSLPTAFMPTLEALWLKAECSYPTNSITNHAGTSDALTNNEFVKKITWFPKLPLIRERGLYPADLSTVRYTCRKLGKAHHCLLPGVVTMHCQHDICYGFQVMLQMESPDTVFSLLKTRFPSAPPVVIYDNACGLHTYCLNRDPMFVKGTQFLIDRYHEPNHKGCSSGYRISSYSNLKGINSEICEQSNSRLKRVRSQLSYMTPDNFMLHAKLFLWFNNKKKSNKN